MENKDIRDYARVKDVKFWQIAKAIGCAPGTLSVWMREKVSNEKHDQIIEAIEEIAAVRG